MDVENTRFFLTKEEWEWKGPRNVGSGSEACPVTLRSRGYQGIYDDEDCANLVAFLRASGYRCLTPPTFSILPLKVPPKRGSGRCQQGSLAKL